MDDFVLENWEEIGERQDLNDFLPLQVDVLEEKQKQSKKGIISEDFEEPIEYASGPRSHTSIESTRADQAKKLKEEKEAEALLSFTQEELDKMLKDSYEKGKEEAMVEVVMSNNEKFAQMEQSLSTVLKDLSDQENLQYQQLEVDAVNLSIEISKKLVDHAVEINPEYILQILREALRLSGGAKIRKIRVSPQDMEFIEVLKIAQTLKEYDGSWTFEADESVRAGCILESSAGSIDFQLDKAWERIKDKVLSLKKE